MNFKDVYDSLIYDVCCECPNKLLMPRKCQRQEDIESRRLRTTQSQKAVKKAFETFQYCICQTNELDTAKPEFGQSVDTDAATELIIKLVEERYANVSAYVVRKVGRRVFLYKWSDAYMTTAKRMQKRLISLECNGQMIPFLIHVIGHDDNVNNPDPEGMEYLRDNMQERMQDCNSLWIVTNEADVMYSVSLQNFSITNVILADGVVMKPGEMLNIKQIYNRDSADLYIRIGEVFQVPNANGSCLFSAHVDLGDNFED